MPEIPYAAHPLFTHQQSTEWGGWGSRTGLQTTHRSNSPPLSPQTILMAHPVSELRIKKADFSHGLYDWWSILFSLLASHRHWWIWSTEWFRGSKQPPWKSELIGHLQHHPKVTEIPAMTPQYQQLLDRPCRRSESTLTQVTCKDSDNHPYKLISPTRLPVQKCLHSWFPK